MARQATIPQLKPNGKVTLARRVYSPKQNGTRERSDIHSSGSMTPTAALDVNVTRQNVIAQLVSLTNA